MGVIRVAKLGEAVKVMELQGEDTVEKLFSAEISAGDHEIRVNGEKADPGQHLKEEDVVTMVPNIRAGR